MEERDYQDLPSYYALMWASASLNSDEYSAKQISYALAQAITNKPHYLEVEKQTNVPWQLIAGLDMRECAFSKRKMLHNGEYLDKVSEITPVGIGPFDSWEDAAVDAIRFRKLHLVKNWDVTSMLEHAERYNGLGYLFHHGEVPSPYIWSMTNHYKSGKYSRDGMFDPNLIDKQVGIAALFLKFKYQNLL